MAATRIVGYVQDQEGQGIPRTRVILEHEGQQVAQRTTNPQGRYTFAKMDLLAGEDYILKCSSTEDYLISFQVEEGQTSLDDMNFVVNVEAREEVLAESLDKDSEDRETKAEVSQRAQKPVKAPSPVPQAASGSAQSPDQAAVQKAAFISKPVDPTDCEVPLENIPQEFREELIEAINVLREQTCCGTFEALLFNWPDCKHVNEICDDSESVLVFCENLKDGFGKLVEACRSTAGKLTAIVDDLNKDCLTLEALNESLKEYEEEISDIMVFYKGLYDLLHLEASTQQFPQEIVRQLEPFLEAPFECHHCTQPLLANLLAITAQGQLVCLEAVVDNCDALQEVADDLIEELKSLGRDNPPAASEFLSSLETLDQNLNNICQRLNGNALTASSHDNLAATSGFLQNMLTDLKKIREDALKLLNDLREAVRLQKFLPSWRERADWLACAKRGLKEFWEEIDDLIRIVRDCLSKVTTELALQAAPTVVGKTNPLIGSPILAGNQVANANALAGIKAALQDIATDKGDAIVGGGGGLDGAVAQRKVSRVVAQVLGRPTGRDPKSFRAALTATFPEDKETGNIVQEPVRGVVSLEAESGQLAASQGTLSHEVQLITKDALEVLDGLRSIGPDTDQEKAEALKEIVHSELTALIGEAGRVDRPRKSRIDEIFDQLLGQNGHLDQLRDELGLNSAGDALNNPDLVTSEEAQLLASMDLLKQYAGTLESAFSRFFRTSAGQDPRDGSFSGRLAFVSLLFSVVAASVRDVEADMDAVGLSAAERRTVFINDPTTTGGSFLISIDSILSWVENFALEEGPDLIAKSGLIGLNRVLNIANSRLWPLVDELVLFSQPASTSLAPHPGLTRSRVQNTLQQLKGQLEQFQ